MNLLLYKASESNKLFSDLVRSLESKNDDKVNIKVFSQLTEIVNFVKANGNAIILIEVRTNREIKVLSTILKKIGPYFKKSYLRVACSYHHPQDKYISKFQKGGVAFYTERFSDTNYFKKRLEGVFNKLTTYGSKSSTAKQSKNKIIQYVEPLGMKDDVWIVKDEKLFKVVLGKFIVKLMGPGPFVLNWEKVRPSKEYPLLKCWTWNQNHKNTELFPEDGIWHFCGDKLPPQYDSNLEQWVFTGNQLALYLKTNNKIIKKFYTTKDNVIIAENSKEGQGRIELIYQSIYGEQSFKKEASTIGGNEEGSGNTESMALGNLSGEGSASDNLEKNWGGDVSGSEKQDGHLSGESETDDLGAYYKGNVKKKKYDPSDEEDDEFNLDDDFDSVEDFEDSNNDIDEENSGLTLTNDIFGGSLKGKGGPDKLQKYMGHDHDFGEEGKNEKGLNDDLDFEIDEIEDVDTNLSSSAEAGNLYDINKKTKENEKANRPKDEIDNQEEGLDGIDIEDDHISDNDEQGDDFSFEEEARDGGLRGRGSTDKIQKYMGHKHDFGEDDLPDIPEIEQDKKTKKGSKGSLGTTKESSDIRTDSSNKSATESGFTGAKEIDPSSGARGSIESSRNNMGEATFGESSSDKKRSEQRKKKSSIFDSEASEAIVIKDKDKDKEDDDYGIDLES
ncbi:MAG: hypothetical protein OEY33_05020, partial [Bdellovibrionales bacterium]|nr:hypothetical protein [Bdellovibrionales bacterium]